MSAIKEAVLDLEEYTGKPADELDNEDLKFLETARDRMFAALESEKAQDAQHDYDIEVALKEATDSQIKEEYNKRFPF